MKNALRQAKRELTALEKKYNRFNGSHSIEIYLDYSLSDKPGKRVYFTTIRNVPTKIFNAIVSKFNGGKR